MDVGATLKICGLSEINKVMLEFKPEYILSLVDPGFGGVSFGFSPEKHKVIHIEDNQVDTEEKKNNILMGLKFLEKVPPESRLLVHCHLGVSRSTAFAVGYLVTKGLDVGQARKEVSKIRPQASPNKLILSTLVGEWDTRNFKQLYQGEVEEKKSEDYWEDSPYGSMDDYLSMLNVHKGVVDILLKTYPHLSGYSMCLDVGGGPGVHAQILNASTGASILIMDNSEKAHTIAKSMGGGEGFHSAIWDMRKTWPFPDGYFDLVYSIQALEHIEEFNVHHVAKESYRKLSKGGQLFLSVAGEDDHRDPDHKTLKPYDWWLEKFCEVGFRKDQVATQNYENLKARAESGPLKGLTREWTVVCLVRVD